MNKSIHKLELVFYANELNNDDLAIIADSFRSMRHLNTIILNVARWVNKE